MRSLSHVSLMINGEEKKFYDSFQENMLHNFLEKYYKFTIVSNIDCLISDIQMRSPFDVKYISETNQLFIYISNSEHVSYNLDFEIRQNNKSISYYLKNIR